MLWQQSEKVTYGKLAGYSKRELRMGRCSSQARLTELFGAYSPPQLPPPSNCKFASEDDAHVRTNAQIKFLVLFPASVSLCHKGFKKHLLIKISIKKFI